MDIRYLYATQLSNHFQMDIRYSLIKRPSNDIPDGYSQMDIRYSNIKCPSDYLTHDIRYSNIKHPSDQLPNNDLTDGYPFGRLSDGGLTFEYRISIWELVRWTFDIRISNIHLGAG